MSRIATFNALVTQSWNRVRSSAEIDNFLTRRELALAKVEILSEEQ